MVSEPATVRLAPRLEEGTGDEEALGGAITGIHEKSEESREKNGEMDWVKLPSVTPLTEQPPSVTPLTTGYRRRRRYSKRGRLLQAKMLSHIQKRK